MTPYNGQYFYPPRTESKIPYTENPVLRMWKGFPDAVAQYKLNGNRNLVKVYPDRRIEFWNRHGEQQKYVIPTPIREYFLGISPIGHWTIWDTELVHFKTKYVKDVVYVFDCLVWESQHLTGTTYVERYSLVKAQVTQILSFTNPQLGVYSAANISVSQWDSAWAEVKKYDFVEGLMLKRTGISSLLTNGTVKSNNGGFMCRIRKSTKNLMF
jgi:hypothetical protein